MKLRQLLIPIGMVVMMIVATGPAKAAGPLADALDDYDFAKKVLVSHVNLRDRAWTSNVNAMDRAEFCSAYHRVIRAFFNMRDSDGYTAWLSKTLGSAFDLDYVNQGSVEVYICHSSGGY
jgi:hypothetical protein